MPALLWERLVGPSGISTLLHTALMQATALFSWLFVFYFYWSIVDVQCCVSFCCTAKWISYPHTCCSVTKSIWPHGSKHNGLPCPSLSPGVCWNSCPLSHELWWCYLTISSSIFPFSCPQSCPASRSFPMSQLLASGCQSIGASASASVLPMNFKGWFPLRLTGLISLQSKGLSGVFSNTTVQKHQFFNAQCSSWPNSHIHALLLEKPSVQFSCSVVSDSLRPHES